MSEATIKTRIEAMLSAIAPSIGTVETAEGFKADWTTAAHWVVVANGSREPTEGNQHRRLYVDWEIWGRQVLDYPGSYASFRAKITQIREKFRADIQLKNGGTAACELASNLVERKLPSPYQIYPGTDGTGRVLCHFCILELTTRDLLIVTNV